MLIKTLRVSEINPARYNPRKDLKPEDSEYKKLKKSILEFDLVEPLVYNQRSGNLIGGHQRLKILKELGIKEVEASVVDLSDEKEKALNLALNKIQGSWDLPKLKDLLEELDTGNFDIEITGFDNVEIEELQTQLFEPAEGLIPEKVETVCKTGDLWQLGNHRLLCGDSTKKDDIERLMGGVKAKLGFTSPPYWVGKEYETQKSVQEIEEFIKLVCESFNIAIQKDESRIVINTSTGFTTSFDKKKKRQVLLLIDKWTNSFYEIGWNLRHIRHWIKEGQLVSTAPKCDMIDQHCEFLGTYENDQGNDIIFNDTLLENEVNILETFYNPMGKSLGQNRTGKKWALRSYWNDIKGNAKQTGHCAAYPTELVERHLLLYSRRGDIVVDLFGGSGTTLISCEKLSRRCFMMEIDEYYASIILRRWANFTGKDPIREDGARLSDYKEGEEICNGKRP